MHLTKKLWIIEKNIKTCFQEYILKFFCPIKFFSFMFSIINLICRFANGVRKNKLHKKIISKNKS